MAAQGSAGMTTKYAKGTRAVGAIMARYCEFVDVARKIWQLNAACKTVQLRLRQTMSELWLAGATPGRQ